MQGLEIRLYIATSLHLAHLAKIMIELELIGLQVHTLVLLLIPLYQ